MSADEKSCTCDPNQRWVSCKIHVQCEEHCKALLRPQTVAEITAALEHWRDHGVQGGCSHGR